MPHCHISWAYHVFLSVRNLIHVPSTPRLLLWPFLKYSLTPETSKDYWWSSLFPLDTLTHRPSSLPELILPLIHLIQVGDVDIPAVLSVLLSRREIAWTMNKELSLRWNRSSLNLSNSMQPYQELTFPKCKNQRRDPTLQTCYPEEMDVIMYVKYPNKCQKSVPKWKILLSYLSQDQWFSARGHFNITFHPYSITGDTEKFWIPQLVWKEQLEASREKPGISINTLQCRKHASFCNKELSRMPVLPTLRNSAVEHPQAADTNSDQ